MTAITVTRRLCQSHYLPHNDSCRKTNVCAVWVLLADVFSGAPLCSQMIQIQSAIQAANQPVMQPSNQPAIPPNLPSNPASAGAPRPSFNSLLRQLSYIDLLAYTQRTHQLTYTHPDTLNCHHAHMSCFCTDGRCRFSSRL